MQGKRHNSLVGSAWLRSLVELAISLINKEQAKCGFDGIYGPFVDADRNDIFWLLLSRDQETPRERFPSSSEFVKPEDTVSQAYSVVTAVIPIGLGFPVHHVTFSSFLGFRIQRRLCE